MHAYLNEHMEEIKGVKGELYGEVVMRDDGTKVREITYGQTYLPLNIAFDFSRVYAVAVDEAVWISVKMLTEGEHACSTDGFRVLNCNRLILHKQARYSH